MPGRCDPPIEHRFSSTNQPKIRGRKKGSISLTAQLKKMLKKSLKHYDPLDKTNKDDNIKNHLINILLAKGLSGEDRALKEILDRIEGKAKESIDINGNMTAVDLTIIMGEWFGNTDTKAKKSDKRINQSKV